MSRFLVPAGLIFALIAGQAQARVGFSMSGASSPGYVAPMIQPPAAFHGGQVTGLPPVQLIQQPNVADPGFNQFPAIAPHHRG